MRLQKLVYFLLPLFFAGCGPEMPGLEDVELNVDNCAPSFNGDQLDIVTWDLQEFPISESSIDFTRDIIDGINPDILALQGVKNAFALSKLLDRTDWKALLFSGSDETTLMGFMYNPAEVSISFLSSPFKDDPDFRRPPVKCTVKHLSTGKEIILWNIHLDCCEQVDARERRGKALRRFKTYLDENYYNDPLILLGNFIDDLSTQSTTPSVSLFVDSQNYQIADLEVASGDSERFSQPENSVHSDHIIISDELFDKVVDVNTIGLDECVPDFFSQVSQHLPVYISLDY